MSVFLILLPLAIAASRLRVEVRHGADRRRACARASIFALLLSLMLTSMPISIALGLTVLTFMFTLTEVPIDSVAMKLFTGIENFEIMAIPFFILAGNFLTHGGVARRMIKFATSMVGHWHGGLGLAACGLRAVRAVSGSSPATVVAIGSVVLPAMVAQGFPARFGAGVITTSGALGILIPPSIADGASTPCPPTPRSGKLFIAGIVPGHPARHHARASPPGTAPGSSTTRACERDLRPERLAGVPRIGRGACC